jgi:hypothetical protein
MKLNPRVTELALYDIRGGPGPFFPSQGKYRLYISPLTFFATN